MRASYDSIDNKQNVCGKINFSTSVTPFSAHCISDQKVRTFMVRAIVGVRVMVRVWVRVRVRLGDVVVRNAVGRKVGNLLLHFETTI